MKNTIEAKPYLTTCDACGRNKIATNYQDFEEIPASTNGSVLCEDCKSGGFTVDTKNLGVRRYHKSCDHKNAPNRTVPAVVDLVVSQNGKKSRIKGQCLHCQAE